MKKSKKNIITYLLLVVLVLSFAYSYRSTLLKAPAVNQEIPFSEMVTRIKGGDFDSVMVQGVTVTGFRGTSEQYYTYAPSEAETYSLYQQYILPRIEEGTLKYYAPKPATMSFWLTVLPNVLMVLSVVLLFFFMMNQGGQNKAFSFGKSRARMVDTKDKKITFADVAGLEEEKQELAEVVDFLKNPKKYKDLGARIPKGMLLVGPPGTGKTYISKATAGEAGVPFFTISGSDFVEMFVGVGASRVRDLFDQAKKNAPCMIFIDEIDAVGRKRGAGIGGGHDEREQTLNQLLVEMDGFEDNSGIIVMAATNRPDILDPALLRPGRFDRRIVIGRPDLKAREAIFKVHAKNKPLADDVTPSILARRTPGFTPADIENLLNEAALITARRNGRKIRMEEIEEAITKVLVGPAKKSQLMNEKDKKLTAFHEAGHAVVNRSLPGSDPVHQVTIVPRGMAGGFTEFLPEEDKSYTTKGEMMNDIIHLLAGRVAEQLTLDDISTGASSDIQRATEIARDMVTRYGFSEKIGTISYGGSEEVFLGNDFTTHKNYSDAVAHDIDMEIKAIIDSAYAKATEILKEHSDILERVANGLLLVETIDAEQFEGLYSGTLTPEQLKEDVDAASKAKAERDAMEAEETQKAIDEEEKRKAEEEAARAEEEKKNGPQVIDLRK